MMDSLKESHLKKMIHLEKEEGKKHSNAPLLPFPPTLDLNTLLKEMVALKQEVRTETKSSRQLRETLNTLLSTQQQVQEGRYQVLVEEQREYESVRLEQISLLIDLIDYLGLSCESAQLLALAQSKKGGFFKKYFTPKQDPALLSLAKGLQLTLRKLRSKLQTLNVIDLVKVGDLFNPQYMMAEGIVHEPHLLDQSIVEILVQGYEQQNPKTHSTKSIIRIARVIVNKHSSVSDK
jgi:hypothetical protein